MVLVHLSYFDIQSPGQLIHSVSYQSVLAENVNPSVQRSNWKSVFQHNNYLKQIHQGIDQSIRGL